MQESTARTRTAAPPRHAGPYERELSTRRTPDRAVLLVSAVALGAGLLLTILTGMAAFAVLVVLTLNVAGLARHVGWRVAFAMTLLAAMVGQVCYLRVTPALGWPLGVSDLLFWALAGAAGIATLARGGIPTLSRRQAETLVLVMVVPVVGITAYVVKMVASGGSWISWSMNNDVVYRSLLVRWALEDHGLRADRGYSDPLTSALLAAWSSVDAGTSAVGHQVRAVVYSGAALWILLWLAVGATCSVIALRDAAPRRAYRAAVAVTVALLPWTWFVSGSAFKLGFQNVAPSLLVILLAWVLWTHRQAHASVCLAGLFLATLAAAMAWAPLALVPLFWSAHTLITERRALRETASPTRLLPVAALSLGIVYGATVTLPETLASGTGGFSSDGAIQSISWRWILGLAVASVAASVLFKGRLSASHRWGLWLAVSASALVAGYLLYQRKDAAVLWGYYPAKFAWLLVTAALLVAVAEIARAASRLRRWWWRAASLAVVAGLALTLMYQITSPWAGGSRFTPIALTQDNSNDGAARTLFKILDTHPKSFVSGYSPGRWLGPTRDGFINFWLFQMGATYPYDPVRTLAYKFDPTDATTACQQVEVWGNGVQVWTTTPSIARAFARKCPSDQVAVRFVDHGRTVTR